MYKVEKRFSFPMGHRLSKHAGLCKNIHGHNFTIMVGVKSDKLDENDMVIDFYNLKTAVEKAVVTTLDHATVLNSKDPLKEKLTNAGMKVKMIPGQDPTAEVLSKIIYETLKKSFGLEFPWIQMDYITVFENENSKATYCEPSVAIFT
jgi:6-pyruvoyltetrahydropterin/6-carboxytetrahydropterin synthase